MTFDEALQFELHVRQQARNEALQDEPWMRTIPRPELVVAYEHAIWHRTVVEMRRARKRPPTWVTEAAETQKTRNTFNWQTDVG